MKKLFISCVGVLLIILCLYTEQAQSKIADSVIRLHILANSDLPKDQRIKINVRDFVLENYGEKLKATSRDDAIKKINDNLSQIQKDISDFCGQDVSLTLCDENFSTRKYDFFSLPSGDYLSLKIVLGEGNGKNWWCVMYPPLCFSEYSTVTDKEKLKSLLSEDEYRLITENNNEVLFKFKTLEIWNKIKTFF